MTATSLHDGDDAPIGYVFIARDITERRKEDEERKRLEARVQGAAKLESLGGLAGGIAHDYNNILTGVLGNVSLALFELPIELPPDSPVRGRLRQIEASAERAAELTDQLLAYAGQEDVVVRPYSLNEVIAEGRPLLEATLPAGARLEVHLRKDLPATRLDPDQIRQAIGNLLTNAADSLGADGGTVMLRTSMVNAKRSYFDGAVLDEGQPAGRYVFVEVSDTGCGMDDETRPAHVRPFLHHQGERPGPRPRRGAGHRAGPPGGDQGLQPAGPRHHHRGAAAGDRGAAAAAGRRLRQRGAGLERLAGLALVVDDETLVRDIASRVLAAPGLRGGGGGERRAGDRPLQVAPPRHPGWCCSTSPCPAWPARRWRASCSRSSLPPASS